MRQASCVAAVLALSACAGIVAETSPDGVTQLALLGGSVTAAAPAGYCLAPEASRPADGFALMTGCTAAVTPAVLTVQVGAEGTPLSVADATALEALLRTDAGRALLSTSSDAGTIDVDATTVTDRTVTVHFSDTGPPAILGVDAAEWRGFFNVNGRLTTIAVRGLATAPLGTDEGAVILQQAIRAMTGAGNLAETAGPG